jgi:hypothetical protein
MERENCEVVEARIWIVGGLMGSFGRGNLEKGLELEGD